MGVDHGLQIFMRYGCNVLVEHCYNHIVRFAGKGGFFANYFIDPATDSVTNHSRFTDLFAHDHRQTIGITSWVGHVFERRHWTTVCFAVLIDEPERIVAMEAVSYSNHLLLPFSFVV